MTPRPIPVIVGPTCSGKSDLGLAVARALDGEIINLDSIQVYRGLDVATAKVPPALRALVPHHLIDVADPAEHYTAGRYAREATACLADIEARGRTAVFVGGTGLYFDALRGRLFAEDNPTDLRLRARLHAIRARHGAPWLHRMLRRLDPATAARLQPNDWSRTMRALEFFLCTRTPLSQRQRQLAPPPPFVARMRLLVLSPPRAELYARINARVEAMVAAGLLDEIRRLLAAGVPPDAEAFQAHGYRRFIEYLRGERTYASAVEQMKTDTRHYAKRQLSWWRREPEAHWLAGFGSDPEVQRQALELLRAPAPVRPGTQLAGELPTSASPSL
ncbi:tRNA (adenosine(37)-N6)-dimethylallyltransferase MiaA [Chloracidobacterium sp. D]|jgi:tRNA dimethylallyltransferase|uniref:tRNA (adenosine(37)-N6)-dimethylallyltransferase MiaA n=1 Tax=Chloracidobacterium sp. D TaxID=2821536 RepID=UPI001B8BC358|nr:tRNA (adenosine(37)-N6)-dimethylallyltransferase MiaA [Chloracidobacterium sp. D]QUV81611.1 tRNA (adenosine(37)-N6)-dimethylallyltransferase MiaA [Chloracidobacterium sp. D]